MEVHYLINDTMRPMAERWFLPSLPEGFEPREHVSELWTSGDFDKDNYGELMIRRTEMIQREIENRLDGELMLWCDVDIAFYRPCRPELVRLAETMDLLFQKEFADPANLDCNFGVQVIRRNPRTLVFYARLALLQKITDNPHDQSWGNQLLRFEDTPAWSHLPLEYASETNGGLSPKAVLYHANNTLGSDCQARKHQQLEAALRKTGGSEKATPK